MNIERRTLILLVLFNINFDNVKTPIFIVLDDAFSYYSSNVRIFPYSSGNVPLFFAKLHKRYNIKALIYMGHILLSG
jgi:hypothetical protein